MTCCNICLYFSKLYNKAVRLAAEVQDNDPQRDQLRDAIMSVKNDTMLTVLVSRYVHQFVHSVNQSITQKIRQALRKSHSQFVSPSVTLLISQPFHKSVRQCTSLWVVVSQPSNKSVSRCHFAGDSTVANDFWSQSSAAQQVAERWNNSWIQRDTFQPIS